MANSQQFYERLNQLAGTSKKVNESTTSMKNSTLIDFQRAEDGTALGIIKENHDYHVKVSKVKGENISAADFGYIGGFRNKTENQFKTLSEAQKQRNYRLKSLNEAFSLSGKAYLIKEDVKTEKTPLDVKEDVNSFLKNRISEGKKNINEGREEKFKSALKKEKDEISKKTGGLMNETALSEIRKAMGIITEEKDLSTQDSEIKNSDSVAQKAHDPLNKHGNVLSTEDSEIEDKDEIANKKGKEESQAPITDKNAKKEADKAMGKDSVPAKPKSGKSIAVNEGEDLSTEDSEVSDGEILPNKKDKKEPAQAPINDTNAKAEADKNNVSEGKDISTEDSDQDTDDSVAQEKKVTTKPDAEYNNYNQPEKGQKEHKGEPLKPIKQKGSIVAEGEALSTEDSEANPADSIANKTEAPSSDEPSLIVADSEENPADSLANKTNGAPKKSGESLITADSELDADDSLANKTNIREGVEDTLAAAEEKEDELDAVDAEADAEASAEEVPSDIDVDGLDLDVADEPAPEGGEEMPDMGGEEAPAPDMGADVEVDADVELGDEPAPDADPMADAAPEGGGEDADPMVKELEKLVGKVGNAAQQVDLDPNKTDELFSALIGNFEKNLAKAGAEKGQEWTDKIEKATAGEGVDGGEEIAVDAEEAPEGGDPEEDAAFNDAMSAAGGVEEDTPMTLDGEEVVDGNVAAELGIEGGDDEFDIDDPNDVIPDMAEGDCSECGTFESYAQGRGMNLGECSGMEIADLVSGYADAHKEGMNDGDFEGVAVYLADPQVKSDVEEYGHGDYISQAEPFIKNIGEGGAKFGSYEPTIDPLMGEDDEDPTDDASDEVVDDVVVAPEEPVADMGGEEEVLDLTNLPQQPEPTFGGGAEVMGAGVVKPETAAQKSVDVDLQTGKVIVTMNEEEEKLRKIIRHKIEEATGKKKPSLNENEKSKTSKMLDKMIGEQLKTYEKVVGKKIGK